MIKLEDRIRAWTTVGNIIRNLSLSEKSTMIAGAKAENAWFTEANIEKAFQRIISHLDSVALRQWLQYMPEIPSGLRKIGIVMEGTIPLAGFHDMLAILMSGQTMIAKLHKNDSFLPKYIINILLEIEPRFQQYIIFADRLNNADAIVASSKDNLSYFEKYFADMPHLIRKRRTSCAIINGQESSAALTVLGDDIFSYFGLGDRNVSKIFVPENYDFVHLLDSLAAFQPVLHHHRYNNHYDYNKSIYLVNREPHYDTGFVLFKESSELFSPISVIHYEYYRDQKSLTQKILSDQDNLQCVYSYKSWYPESLAFGKASQPELWEYMNDMDTLAFVQKLSYS